MEPNTQGQDAASQDSTTEQAAQTIPVERFNEVYKDREEGKRQLAEVQAALAQATTALAANAQRQAEPQESAEDALDPEDQKKLDRHVGKMMMPIINELKALRGAVSTTRSEPQIDKVRAQLKQINNPVITARTEELMSGLQKSGKLGSLYTPDEVLRQAVGEFSLGQLVTAGQNADERNQYNAGGAPLAQGGAGAGPRRPAQQRQVAGVTAKPMEEMSIDELDAYIQASEKAKPEGYEF